MFIEKEKKSRPVWPWLALVSVIILIAGSIGIFLFAKNFSSNKFLVEKIIEKYVPEEQGELFKLIPKLLGFDSPKTFLVLFLNNTEIRPAGGFIGSYSVVRVEDGKLEVLKIEGTETLDKNTPVDWKPVPPEPITKYLGVDRWFFRDSNWNPDFSKSADKSLEFYKAEGGVSADEIDAVIGVTPAVIEGLLKVSGPVTVQGITFNEQNVTEKLEYEVEYGYKDRGISVANRKAIMGPLMSVILNRVKKDMYTNYDSYIKLFSDLANQKHIMIASKNKSLEEKIKAFGWGGEMIDTDGDYLAWVDANLAALKTDHAIDRTLSYTVSKRDDGKYLATASMHYQHNGTFDWRTTRYLSYVRVFVPEHAEISSVSGVGKGSDILQAENVDSGVENGKKWFGAYISLEPGQIRDVQFTYTMDEKDVLSKKELYTLVVQKQAGTLKHGLTLDLDFDKNIDTAEPEEEKDKWGDTQYFLNTDLLVDREFRVTLKK